MFTTLQPCLKNPLKPDCDSLVPLFQPPPWMLMMTGTGWALAVFKYKSMRPSQGPTLLYTVLSWLV